MAWVQAGNSTYPNRWAISPVPHVYCLRKWYGFLKKQINDFRTECFILQETYLKEKKARCGLLVKNLPGTSAQSSELNVITKGEKEHSYTNPGSPSTRLCKSCILPTSVTCVSCSSCSCPEMDTPIKHRPSQSNLWTWHHHWVTMKLDSGSSSYTSIFKKMLQLPL